MRRIFFVTFACLLLLSQIPSAQAQADGVAATAMKTAKMFMMDAAYFTRVSFLKVVLFLEETLMGNRLSANIRKDITKTEQYWTHEAETIRSDGVCCRPLECLKRPDTACASMCVPCDGVKRELDAYWK